MTARSEWGPRPGSPCGAVVTVTRVVVSKAARFPDDHLGAGLRDTADERKHGDGRGTALGEGESFVHGDGAAPRR